MLLAAIALSPGVAMIWFFRSRARQSRDRLSLLMVLFVLGGMAAGPSLVLNHAIEKYTVLWPGAIQAGYRAGFWMLGPGLNEEVTKLAVLLAVVWLRRGRWSPYQGLIYGATVAAGFAVVENLFYLERYGTGTMLTRSLLTVPAHAFFTIPMGVMLGYAKSAEGPLHKYALLVGGLAVAVVLHGGYDVLLSLPGAWSRTAYAQVVLMGVAVLVMLPRIPQHLPASPEERP